VWQFGAKLVFVRTTTQFLPCF